MYSICFPWKACPMEPNGEHAQRSSRLEKIAWYKNINKYIGDDECLYDKIQQKKFIEIILVKLMKYANVHMS